MGVYIEAAGASTSLLAGGGRDEAVPRQSAAGHFIPAAMRRATQITLGNPNCGRRATGEAGLLVGNAGGRWFEGTRRGRYCSTALRTGGY